MSVSNLYRIDYFCNPYVELITFPLSLESNLRMLVYYVCRYSPVTTAVMIDLHGPDISIKIYNLRLFVFPSANCRKKTMLIVNIAAFVLGIDYVVKLCKSRLFI